MQTSSSWVHGNALTLETPVGYKDDGTERFRLILTPRGWGAEVRCTAGFGESWMHVPIPTVNIDPNTFELFELVRVFILFYSVNSHIAYVHVYDGYNKIQAFEGVNSGGLWLQGNLLVKRPQNTFNLDRPHLIKTGVGLSFLYLTDGAVDASSGDNAQSLMVAAVGAEFQTRSVFSRPLH